MYIPELYVSEQTIIATWSLYSVLYYHLDYCIRIAVFTQTSLIIYSVST